MHGFGRADDRETALHHGLKFGGKPVAGFGPETPPKFDEARVEFIPRTSSNRRRSFVCVRYEDVAIESHESVTAGSSGAFSGVTIERRAGALGRSAKDDVGVIASRPDCRFRRSNRYPQRRVRLLQRR